MMNELNTSYLILLLMRYKLIRSRHIINMPVPASNDLHASAEGSTRGTDRSIVRWMALLFLRLLLESASSY